MCAGEGGIQGRCIVGIRAANTRPTGSQIHKVHWLAAGGDDLRFIAAQQQFDDAPAERIMGTGNQQARRKQPGHRMAPPGGVCRLRRNAIAAMRGLRSFMVELPPERIQRCGRHRAAGRRAHTLPARSRAPARGRARR